MKIKFFGAWWGLDHLGMRGMVKKVKSAGYDGIEIGIPKDKKLRYELQRLLEDFDLEIIAHQYEATGNNPTEYADSLKCFMDIAAAFKPILINSHTGKDFWPVESNLQFIDLCDPVEKIYGVPILHETHRGRFLYAPSVASAYFHRRPNLKINFDLSHWCCVSESLLEDQTEAVHLAIARAHHIHARVGHAQGPQITDMRNPYWENEVQVFTKWWKEVYLARKRDGNPSITITPEFGPLPYAPINDTGTTAYINFFEQNLIVMEHLKECEQQWKLELSP